MSERFYAPTLDRAATHHTLDGPEAHHLIRVCRAQVGTQVELFDGRGSRVVAIVRDIRKRSADLELGEWTTSEPPRPLTVATALPKGDRASFLVEKCVELGATTLIPLTTTRSVTHPREGKREKLERVVVEACKQCGRDDLMQVETLAPLDKVLSHPGHRWLLDPSGDEPGHLPLAKPDMVAIGPEGGWTPEERDAARLAGCRLVRAPGYVLRIETAVIAAIVLARLS